MAFTYDLTTNLGKVRLLIPDNDSTAYDLADDEITYFLMQSGSNVNAAAVKACMWLSRKYAKKASFSADGLSMQYTQRAAEFAARAKELQAESLGSMGTAALTRSDGYSENAAVSEYQSRIVYIKI